MIKRSNIFFFTKYENQGANTRYRSKIFFPFIEDSGFRCVQLYFFSDRYLLKKYSRDTSCFIFLFSAVFRRILDCIMVPRESIVFIEYELIPFAPPVLEHFLKKKGCILVFDYDDAIISRYDNLRSSLARTFLGNKMAYLFELSSHVICGNAYLRQAALEKGAHAVSVIPTTLDSDRYLPPFLFKNSPVVIGWIGSPTSSRYLLRLRNVFVCLSEKFDIEIRLIGANTCLFGDLSCVSHFQWSEKTENDDIRWFDIGIMPLQYDGWAEGKCGFKILQYMASYIPFVASPIGVNCDLVNNSKGGFVAGSDEEWFERLSTLILSRNLRGAMGKNGRKFVEENYDVTIASRKLVSLLERCETGRG